MAKKLLPAMMALLIVIVSSCGGNGALFGCWENASSNLRFEFYSDGTFVQKRGVGTRLNSCTGSWTIEDGNRILLIIDTNIDGSYMYKISGAKLTLSNDDGLVMAFNKKNRFAK